ncbi:MULTISPECIES: AMP-binding protein [Burkholderia]|uniref:Acyl-CoA synthetase (AMP-forming)/AMP-acid ligase II n=1 Tax=Burkholderia pyrrocinia TaxID=60550 RepID=A0A318I243_BURPY|nr:MULTISPECIES: AMP-binding protein [Burkholderia]PXX21687.1 acyl-CoA synthetase (AMP-forming)/AMP-acid ligase II [Burkholderia pyrrocinia]SFW90300.1 Acyl-CoA synthetase (AMP-forming)/AMP-acid ligase II [Burkholderia sp. NFACC33-1]SFY46442.1 Acyl-CoA synthetase (AMP-forming)/AMP-acid ligase II [Burkholderia sp. NFPP32]
MTTETFPTTLTELLRHRAHTMRDKIAYVFLSGTPDHEQEDSMTFADVDERACRIAALLRQQAVGIGDRVLLMCRPGLDYIGAFMGCLYAGAIAVPVYPPRNRQHMLRIASVVESAGASTILCSTEDLTRCRAWLADTAASGCRLLDVGAAAAMDPTRAPVDVTPSNLAFLHYTTGTTGTPKGVMISHANLMHNLGQICEWLGAGEQSTIVSWLPPYHGMGLIGAILTSLFGGFRSVTMAPERFIQHPFLWLRAISQYRADLTGGPDFAYRMCCRRVPDAQLSMLDLTCVKAAYSGAESVWAGTLSEFARRFGATGFAVSSFLPYYGLAEGTLFVTGRNAQRPIRTVGIDQAALRQQSVVVRGEFLGVSSELLERPGERTLVSVGQAGGGQQVIVCDPHTMERCADRMIGEICVTGPSVAAGYWNLDEQTHSTFRCDPKSAGKTYLRTGDLGFLRGGELYVTGRLKDMVILSGRSYYAEDIEYAVIADAPELVPNGCAAFTDDGDDAERLIVVAEVERKWRKGNVDGMIDTIRKTIWNHLGIGASTVVLVTPGSVPKTSSGKVRRCACRARLRDGTMMTLSRWDVAMGAQASGHDRLRFDSSVSGFDASPARCHDGPAAPNVDELIDWLRDYARTRIDSRSIDERRTIAPHIVLDFGNRGILGMLVDRSYGGLGLSHRDMLRVISHLATIDSTLAFFVGLNNTLGILPIMRHAQPALRDELLPKLATGRMLAAFAITEPGAGSYPRAMASRARQIEGGDWLVSGHKCWSGSSAWAGIVNVFAWQADGAGMVGLAVRPGAPGVRIGAEALTMGVRGMIQNSLHLDDARITDVCRLGVAGHGMAVAQEAMNIARLGIASICTGVMKRCAQLMHRYGARREIATGLLLDNPLSRQRLGDLRHRINGMDALVAHLATDLDKGVELPEDGLLIAKILGSELLSQSADEMMQFLGGRGYIETNLVPQIYRDARLTRIFEGPTETLLTHLGSRLQSGNDDLLGYLERSLGAEAMARELHELGDAMMEDGLTNASNLGGAAHAAIWVNYWFGAVAQWALLLTVVERAAARHQVDDATRDWARNQYELAIELAQRQICSRATLWSSAELNAWARDNGLEIGSIEQTVPGASQQLDPLLRAGDDTHPDDGAPGHDIGEGADAIPPPNGSAPTRMVERELSYSLERWLIDWLSERLESRSLCLAPETTFAEIGLDSVLAVELALEFNETFRVTVDEAMVRDYPSISTLAAHLAPRLWRTQSVCDDANARSIHAVRSSTM